MSNSSLIAPGDYTPTRYAPSSEPLPPSAASAAPPPPPAPPSVEDTSFGRGPLAPSTASVLRARGIRTATDAGAASANPVKQGLDAFDRRATPAPFGLAALALAVLSSCHPPSAAPGTQPPVDMALGAAPTSVSPSTPPFDDAPQAGAEAGVLHEIIEGGPGLKTTTNVAPCAVRGVDLLCGAPALIAMRDGRAQRAPDLEWGLPHEADGRLPGRVQAVVGRWPEDAWLTFDRFVEGEHVRRSLYRRVGQRWREVFARRGGLGHLAPRGETFYWKRTAFLGDYALESVSCGLRAFGPAKAPFTVPACSPALLDDPERPFVSHAVARSGELMLASTRPAEEAPPVLDFWGEGGEHAHVVLPLRSPAPTEPRCRFDGFHAESSRQILLYGERTDAPRPCAYLYDGAVASPLALPDVAGRAADLRRDDDGHLWLSLLPTSSGHGVELWQRPPGEAWRRVALPRLNAPLQGERSITALELNLRGPGDLWVTAAAEDEDGKGTTIVYRSVAPSALIVCGWGACPPWP